MLPLFDDSLHAKNLRGRSIPSLDIDDQRILQSGWMRGTTGYSQPNVVASDAIFLCWLYLHAKHLRDHLIPSRNTDDKRILRFG